MTQTQTQMSIESNITPSVTAVLALIRRRHVAILSTVSPAGRPHAATVQYAAVGSTLYVSTDRGSRKGKNLSANPHVGVVIPVRRVPIGPPSSIQFQGTATVLTPDDAEITGLAAAGKIDAITAHGELDREDVCFVRIEPGSRIHTYGLGMSLLRLVRHPLDAAGSVPWPPVE